MAGLHLFSADLSAFRSASVREVGAAVVSLARMSKPGSQVDESTSLGDGRLHRFATVDTSKVQLVVFDDQGARLVESGRGGVGEFIATNDVDAVWTRPVDEHDRDVITELSDTARSECGRHSHATLAAWDLPPLQWPEDGAVVFGMRDVDVRWHRHTDADALGDVIVSTLRSPWEPTPLRTAVLVAGVHLSGSVVLVAAHGRLTRFRRLMETDPDFAAAVPYLTSRAS